MWQQWTQREERKRPQTGTQKFKSEQREDRANKKNDKMPDLNLSKLNVNHRGTTITGPHSVSKKPS